MRKVLIILSAAVAVLACSKEPVNRGLASEDISFSAMDGTTKALLTDRTLKTNGNRIHVMDVLSSFSGTASWMSGNLYINDEIVYAGKAVWDYYSGRTYPWTTDGTHRFFAWLSYDTALDQTADSFFGTTLSGAFDSSAKPLDIPAIEMNTQSTQFDFLYTSTANYTMPRTETTPIPLSMKHLFSAISLQFRNDSQDQILIHSVSIEGLKNKKSAQITFVGSPTLTTNTASADFVNNSSYSNFDQTLVYNDTYDLLAGTKNTTAEYRLIWPQSEDDLNPSNAEDYTTYPITVHYEYLADEEHIQHTAHLRFPEGTVLEAGTRYAFTLLFTQKHVQLDIRVNPWIYELNEWSFTEQTISEVTELSFRNNPGYDVSSKNCRIVNGQNVTGTFSIVNPTGATWSIEPIGDVEYFTISPNQGMVDSTNPDYSFEVIPNLDSSLDRTEDKELRFHFYVKFTDGTFHDANTEINRDDVCVILPKN